jgi:hypothetical protein
MSSFTKTEAGRDFALGMQAFKRLAQPDDIGGSALITEFEQGLSKTPELQLKTRAASAR